MKNLDGNLAEYHLKNIMLRLSSSSKKHKIMPKSASMSY